MHWDGNTETIFDETYLAQSMELDDKDFLAEVYEIYVNQANVMVNDMIHKASDLATVKDNLSCITDLAHKLKSSSRSVGAFRMGHLMELIEAACRQQDADGAVMHIESLADVLARTVAAIGARLSNLK